MLRMFYEIRRYMYIYAGFRVENIAVPGKY